MEYLKQGDGWALSNTVPKSRKITLHKEISSWYYIKIKASKFYHQITIHSTPGYEYAWYNPNSRGQEHLDRILFLYLLGKEIPFVYRKNGTQGMRLEIPIQYINIKQ